jgi:thioredoxin-related protein
LVINLGRFGLLVLLSVASVAGPSPTRAAERSVNWHSFNEGMARGGAEGKKVFILFRADWCTYCHAMETETLRDPTVVAFLKERFISVKVDTDREQDVSTMFRVKGLPDCWFFSEDGSVLGHRPGYIPPDVFLKILRSLTAEGEPAN